MNIINHIDIKHNNNKTNTKVEDVDISIGKL